MNRGERMNMSQDIPFSQEKRVGVKELKQVYEARNIHINTGRDNSPIFIVGFSRTGSTLLQNLLNTYTEVCIAPELHIHWPTRLHNDFAINIQTASGRPKKG